MLWLYVTVTLALFSGLKTEDPEVIPDDPILALQHFFEARCLKNANADVTQEVKDSIHSLRKCLNEHDGKIPKTEEDVFNVLCSEVPQNYYRCIGNVIRKLEPCLDAEEKYFPRLLGETFNSTVEEFCKGGPSDVIALLDKIHFAKCNDKSEDQLKLEIVQECLPKLQLLQRPEEAFVLRESELCNDLHEVKECVASILTNCTDNVLKETLAIAFKPVISRCSAQESENVVD